MSGTVLNVELQDVDVSYLVTKEPSRDDSPEVEITKVEFRGVDITRLLKRKELLSIQCDVECEVEKRAGL